MALVDAITTAAAGVVAVGVRIALGSDGLSFGAFVPVRTYATLLPALALLLLVRFAFGLYPGYGLTAPDELRRQTWSSTFVVAAFAVLGLVFRFSADYSRTVLGLVALWVFVGLPLVRAGLKQLMANSPRYGLPVLVLGESPRALTLVELLRATPTLGIRPRPVGQTLPAASHPPSTRILIVPEGLAGQSLAQLLDDLASKFTNVWLVPDLLDISSAWVTVQDLQGHLTLRLRNNLAEPVNRWLKRTTEWIILLLASPFAVVALGLIAAAIRLDSPGDVFYTQTRIGRHGRPFRILKFRTMYLDADRRLHDVLAVDPERAAEWERARKLANDPRVTRVGKWLRRTSLDELPQLVNILRGQMSLVGPRAITRSELHLYGMHRHLYTSVLPGLTGLWQVSGRSLLDYPQRVRLDTYYVRNWSLWLDLVILARTPLSVMRQHGAF